MTPITFALNADDVVSNWTVSFDASPKTMFSVSLDYGVEAVATGAWFIPKNEEAMGPQLREFLALHLSAAFADHAPAMACRIVAAWAAYLRG